MAKKIIGPLEVFSMLGLDVEINGQSVEGGRSTQDWILFLLDLDGPQDIRDLAKMFGAKTAREAFYFGKLYLSPLIEQGKVVKRPHPDYRYELAQEA